MFTSKNKYNIILEFFQLILRKIVNFVIDKYTAKKLYGKILSITLQNETKEQMIIPNSVSEYGQPYCFMLEIGGKEHEK